MKKNYYDAFIFIGGEFPEKNKLSDIATPDLIIAADSGYLTAKQLGYEVGHVIGDFDSVDIVRVQKECVDVQIHAFPRDKDFSDTELALDLAQKLGSKNPVLIGGGGGRADHFLALTRIFDQEFFPGIWITKHEMIFALQGMISLELEVGKTISFYPLKEAPELVESVGLTWELNGVCWKDGYFSLSNMVEKSPVSLNIHGGRILSILPYQT